MADADPAPGRAHREASDWFARLKRRQVSLTDLEAFRVWRENPDNRAAYGAVDDAWRLAGTLSGEAATRQAVNDALRRGAARRNRRERRAAGLAGAAAALAVVLVLAGGAAFYLTARPTFETGVGEQRLVHLADGSSVRLDTDTRIAVAFSGTTRRVSLERGQALFEVAHDTTRPFLVAAGPLTVRAVGTRFDVRMAGPEPSVTLVQGVVEVTSAGTQALRWTLKPGQQVTAAAPAPRPVDLDAATSWTTGRIVFQNVPLSDAIAEINRYATHKVVLQAPAVASMEVSGSFETGDVAAFVSAESDLHGLKATHAPDGSIVLAPAHSTPG
jgi:transmembrane sensor